MKETEMDEKKKAVIAAWADKFGGEVKAALKQVSELCSQFGRDICSDFSNERINFVKWEATGATRFNLTVYLDDVVSYLCGGAA
jgi:hypothetical protein